MSKSTDHPGKDETTLNEYEIAREEVAKGSSELRKDLTSFVLAIMAATWALWNKGEIGNVDVVRYIFALGIVSIGINILGRICRINHYDQVVNDSKIPLRADSTCSGRVANGTWWFSIISTLITLGLFIYGVVM